MTKNEMCEKNLPQRIIYVYRYVTDTLPLQNKHEIGEKTVARRGKKVGGGGKAGMEWEVGR